MERLYLLQWVSLRQADPAYPPKSRHCLSERYFLHSCLESHLRTSRSFWDLRNCGAPHRNFLLVWNPLAALDQVNAVDLCGSVRNILVRTSERLTANSSSGVPQKSPLWSHSATAGLLEWAQQNSNGLRSSRKHALSYMFYNPLLDVWLILPLFYRS